MKNSLLLSISILLAAVVVAGAILVGTGSVGYWNPFDPYSTVKHEVAQSLINPESAKFKNISEDTVLEGQYCGKVNGKNRLGTYAGWSTFHAAKDDGEWDVTIGKVARALCGGE